MEEINGRRYRLGRRRWQLLFYLRLLSEPKKAAIFFFLGGFYYYFYFFAGAQRYWVTIHEIIGGHNYTSA